MDNNPEKFEDESKVTRLVEYLIRLASLRTKIIRDVSEYQNVFWINEIPKQKGCFTQAWGRDDDFDSDVWIEVQTWREPELPSVPSLCEDWTNEESLRNKDDIPDLLPEITKQVKNSAWQEESNQPEFVSRTQRLDDHPNVQRAWYRYVDEHWLPWVEAHSDWESIHRVYSELFAIHQEQLRLSEEYELVLALGLLTWKTPSGQRVRRHLIVANAVLEFEAKLGKFTVGPLPDGANVRPELDMLDVAEQPPRAEKAAKDSLAEVGVDDPWNKDCIEGVLQGLVHSINPQGEYDSALGAKSNRVSDKPIVEYSPALILRKRSARGLTETLKRIKENIKNGDGIPDQFADLAEIRSDSEIPSASDPGETNGAFNGEVFFPKPSNEEQRCIVKKIQTASGVLVQGPPGTGKSHTIANLICHLLATGKRTLVTAKTPRALRVLEKLVPGELAPLCINLLGSGLEEKQSLESSVGGILRKNGDWNEDRAASKIENLERNLRKLREEKTKVDRRLRAIRESETHSQSIAEGTYRGTAARIAESVNQNRSVYDWFTDIAPLDKTCPVSENELQRLLTGLRRFGSEKREEFHWVNKSVGRKLLTSRFRSEKREELRLVWPDNLPPVEQFANLLESERRAKRECEQSSDGADAQIAEILSSVAQGSIEAIRDSLTNLNDFVRRAPPNSWMRDAVRDITVGNALEWRERHRVTQATIDVIEPLVSVADETSVEFPDGVNIRNLFEDTCQLKAYLETGGKLGWGPFRPKPVKEHIHVLKTVRLNGRSCSDLKQLSVLADALRVRIECEKAWKFWVGRQEQTEGPYALQLPVLKSLSNALNNALSLIENYRATMRQFPSLQEPGNQSQIEQLIASCRFALANQAKRLVAEKIRSIEEPVVSLDERTNAHPVTSRLLQAIRNRDVDGYRQVRNKIQDLEKERRIMQQLDEEIEQLRQLVPKLTAELEQSCDDSCWDARIQQVQNAWRWSQAKFWVDEYIKKEDAPSLAIRARQIENEINKITEGLAALHAWSFCFSRLEDTHRRHMVAWQQSMRRLGKGTGKHAPRHRREAQQHLNECRAAVPAWVMPLHRVWDTVDPAPGMFDVVIVDEASQCGPEALPLFYLGKKILIVGDDKQISPDAVGLDRNAMVGLMKQFLYDFEFKSTFDVESSLFDHGRTQFGTGITLREHFRSMPEIIRFSNELCYSDTPLVPLRQYGPERLTALEHTFVEGGYREGSGNRVMNRPEADAIVRKIAELCADERYSGKTMGVVVLQGEAQAGLIGEKLLERLGAEEMVRRRLVCGNPYSFQGDERDVMFLSMIAATNERIGSFTKTADERRFNVAASRARDQMFLFHSVTVNDLSTLCLRRRLLEFFENTAPQEIAGIDREELERKAVQSNRAVIKPPTPFGSWFEVDVALELMRKGFNVQPQYEVAGKRVDLVVEGGQARLAVECDGDEWHGMDQYEADMQRQRQLERCGWEFFRVRESAFYANKEAALDRLWPMLEERSIFPGASGGNQRSVPVDGDENDDDEDDCDKAKNDGQDIEVSKRSAGDSGSAESLSGRRT